MYGTCKELKFGNRTFYPVVRTLGEMKDVVCDKRFLAHANKDMGPYYMFRDVSRDKEDAKKIKARELRYDITVIPPNTLFSRHFYPPMRRSNNYLRIDRIHLDLKLTCFPSSLC
jgi:hypothetical protein